MHKSRLTVEVEELSCLLVDHVSLIRPLDATTLNIAEKSVDISLSFDIKLQHNSGSKSE